MPLKATLHETTRLICSLLPPEVISCDVWPSNVCSWTSVLVSSDIILLLEQCRSIMWSSREYMAETYILGFERENWLILFGKPQHMFSFFYCIHNFFVCLHCWRSSIITSLIYRKKFQIFSFLSVNLVQSLSVWWVIPRKIHQFTFVCNYAG